MRAFLVLLSKDLREARATLLLLVPLALVCAAIVVFESGKNKIDTSAFAPLRALSISVLPCAALALSHVVVARELTGKTQLFLEALPVRRSFFFVEKLLIVVGGTMLVAFALWLGTLAARAPEGLREVMCVRMLAFAAVLGAFFFLVGFLGRYRIPLALLVVIAAVVLVQGKQIEVARVAPFALVDQTLAFERSALPWDVLQQSVFLVISCVLAAAVIVGAREGDLPARLAETMSQRERVFIAIAMMTILIGVFALDEKRTKAPYDLPKAARVATDGVDVAVGSGVGEAAEVDHALAASLHEGLAVAQSITGLTFARVLIVPSWDVPEGVVERAELESADGLMFRVRPPATPSSDDDDARLTGAAAARRRAHERLLTTAVHGVVARATYGRAMKEDRHFVLDGFGAVVARIDHFDAPPADVRDDDLWLRALASGLAPTRASLDAWFTTEERVGNTAANAFAFTGLRVLAHEVGGDKARAFLRGVLGMHLSTDTRAMWQTPDVDDVLMATCGLTRAAWLAAWQREAAAARVRLAAELAQQRAPIDATLTLVPLSSKTSKAVLVALTPDGDGDGDGDDDDDDTRIELDTATLSISRAAIDDDDGSRLEYAASVLRAPGLTLPMSIASGDRFAWRIITLDARAGERIEGPWHRVEVP